MGTKGIRRVSNVELDKIILIGVLARYVYTIHVRLVQELAMFFSHEICTAKLYRFRYTVEPV